MNYRVNLKACGRKSQFKAIQFASYVYNCLLFSRKKGKSVYIKPICPLFSARFLFCIVSLLTHFFNIFSFNTAKFVKAMVSYCINIITFPCHLRHMQMQPDYWLFKTNSHHLLLPNLPYIPKFVHFHEEQKKFLLHRENQFLPRNIHSYIFHLVHPD